MQFTLGLMDQCTTLIRNIEQQVVSAADKINDKDKELDLSEAYKKCEELKDFCKKQVQKQALEIQSSRTIITKDEMEGFKNEFQRAQINARAKSLREESNELDQAVKKLETAVNTHLASNPTKLADAKKSIEDLKKHFGEAQAEFESLNRKSS